MKNTAGACIIIVMSINTIIIVLEIHLLIIRFKIEKHGIKN